MAKSVIYETKGRAREFNPLAINLFSGCGHRCTYCYGAEVTHQTRAAFETSPHPRVTVEEIAHSAREWAEKGEKRRVLLCFVTDPYQPAEAESQLTRKAIMALHAAGLNVIILTKGGNRSLRDFDLLTPKDAYATTLTLVNEGLSAKYEPGAAPPRERIEALKLAHERGIETWVSCEPVINPTTTMALVMGSYPFVGHFKVGTLNYSSEAAFIDWGRFGWQIKRFMDRNHILYYFKRDLVEKMNVPFERFHQTWECR